MSENESERLRSAALDYHALPRPGKLEVRPTKPLANPIDLARAYSPGVAEASLAIVKDPANAELYTGRGNLVAVVSNGTATLGLGNIGPLACKPVMEGKAVLFKKFANIDCFDIELAENDPYRLAENIIALEPTFGAINLEDIKAPDCFIVEAICRERMSIPVFHDDQHGTAIVVAAAALNALLLTNRNISEIKIVSSGGGAAGIACLDMLVALGAKRENIWLYDQYGLVHENRTGNTTSQKQNYAQKDCGDSLEKALDEADFFLGLSAPRIIEKSWISKMTAKPIVFALANPTPEIMPEEALEAVPDAIIATGRSDYPNQVNNVLCFPFIFRGALDVGATEINESMKMACVKAIAELARSPSSDANAGAYGGDTPVFSAGYLIPKPFDSRLLGVVATAVAEAASLSGCAKRPLKDADAYRRKLDASVFRSSLIMRPVFEAARNSGRRIVFAEGEDERVLRAAAAIGDEINNKPILIGRPDIINQRCLRFGIPAQATRHFEIVNPESDHRYREYWETYHSILERSGVTPDAARATLRNNTTVIAAIMVQRGEADSMICGTVGEYHWHLQHLRQCLSSKELAPVGAMSLIILDSGPMFVADTHVNHLASPEQIVSVVQASARHVRRFGIEPLVALCSNSQFGNLDTESALRMRKAISILDSNEQDFQYEGEMHVDLAVDPDLRQRIFPNSKLKAKANILIFSGAETANAVRNTLKSFSNGIEVGPILMGMGNRAHIATPSVTTRGLINIAALAATPVLKYS